MDRRVEYAARRSRQGLMLAVGALLVVQRFRALAACVTSVAVAACWLPADRASRIDPQTGLRQS